MRHNRAQAVRGLVLIAILGTILCGILFVVQVQPDYARRRENPYQEEWSLESADRTDIRIDLSAVNIRMEPYDGEEIQVSFEGRYRSTSKKETFPLTVTMDSRTLNIHEKSATQGLINFGPWNFDTLQGDLTILLPQEHYGKITIESFSGNVSMEHLQADALRVEASSGRLATADLQVDGSLHLESFSGAHSHRNLEAKACTISSSSGSITLSGGDFDSLKVNSFSGKVEVSDLTITQKATLEGSNGTMQVENLRADSLRCQTFSGTVTLTACETGQLSVETSSGRVQATLPEMPVGTDIQTFSGGVTLTLPADANFTCTTESFSGSTTIDFPSTLKETSSGNAHVVGDGSNRIHIETSSGKIVVKPQ